MRLTQWVPHCKTRPSLHMIAHARSGPGSRKPTPLTLGRLPALRSDEMYKHDHAKVDMSAGDV